MTTAAQYAANTVRKGAPVTRAVVGATPFSTVANMQLGQIATGDGTASPASDTANQRVMGVFTQGNYLGATGTTVELQGGIWGFTNSSLHPVAATGLGAVCYVEGVTGYIVAASGGTCNSNVAGRVVDLDVTNGIVYVDVGRPNTTV